MQEDLSQYLTNVKRPSTEPRSVVSKEKRAVVYTALREVKTGLPSNKTNFSDSYASL